MQLLKSLLPVCLLLICLHSEAQWQVVQVPFNDLHVSSIRYTGKDKIWCNSFAGGTSYITISDDGGLHFRSVDTLISSIFSVQPLNDRIAFAVGIRDTGAWKNILISTKDGGFTWDKVNVSDTMHPFSSPTLVSFDQKNLCLFNHNKGQYTSCMEVFTSNDSGITWSRVPCAKINSSVNSGNTNKLMFKQEAFAKICVDSGMMITRDYGQSWELVRSENKSLRWLMVAFQDSANGIGFRSYTSGISTLHFTSDGGITWDSSTTTYPQVLTLNYVTDSAGQNFYIAAGESGSITSYDGKSWKILDTERHHMQGFFDSRNGLSICPLSSSGQGAMIFRGLPNGVEQLTPIQRLPVYPNPAGSFIQSEMPLAGSTCEIMDRTGRIVSNPAPDRNNRIDVSELVPGIYLLKIQSPEGVSVAVFCRE